MKALWITLAATVFLLIIWGSFLNFAGEDIDKMISNIDAAVEFISQEDWDMGQSAINKVFDNWFDKRLIYSLFFDAISIGDLETAMFKADAYIKSEEKSAAIAELAGLRHLLAFLYENETISIENIL